MTKHVVWTQWDDLVVPSAIKRLSPATTPIDSADLSEITFYVPTYMGGKAALELTKKMPNLKVLQMPNAGYDDALEYVRDGMTLCNGKGIHDDSTAELAVGLTIASLRGFPDFVRNQDKSAWIHVKNNSINDIASCHHVFVSMHLLHIRIRLHLLSIRFAVAKILVLLA